MSRRFIIFFAMLALSGVASSTLIACRKELPPTAGENAPGAVAKTPAKAPSPDPAADEGRKTFGAAIGQGDTIPIAAVLKDPTSFAERSVIVTGQVRTACERRGCWMEMVPAGDMEAPGTRVTFKDYGFFVPTDSKGLQARVEGVVAVRTIDDDEVEHMEKEGGRFEDKAADGTAREVRLVATGVELWK